MIFHCPAQARRDEATGRDFFIDHNTRRTTWERPPSPMASAGGTTPEEATPVGGSPEGSSGDLAARDAEATGNAAASAAAGDAAAEGPGVGGDLAEREEYGGAQPRRGWGLFGLRVDEVPAFGISLQPCSNEGVSLYSLGVVICAQATPPSRIGHWRFMQSMSGHKA